MIQTLNKYIRMKECNSIHFEYGGFMHCHVGCPSRYSDVMLNCLAVSMRMLNISICTYNIYIYISLRMLHIHIYIYTHTVYTADTLYLQNVHTRAPSSRGALHGSVTGCHFTIPSGLTGTTLPPPQQTPWFAETASSHQTSAFFSDAEPLEGCIYPP